VGSHPLRWMQKVVDGPKWCGLDDVSRVWRHSVGGVCSHPLSWHRRGRSVVCTPRAPLVEVRTQGLHVVVARWVAAVTGFLGLEMLRSVCCGVVEHWSADDAIVGYVISMHGAVEAMGGCANSSLGAGVASVR
jgi:hypothetical protein